MMWQISTDTDVEQMSIWDLTTFILVIHVNEAHFKNSFLQLAYQNM